MMKVMLVDDEKLIIEGLKRIVDWEKLEMEIVQVAENGQDAIEKYNRNNVDLIITDINMPVMTGLDLIKEVRKQNESVKFIILSGYDDFEYAKKAIGLGVENYILKPINEEELEDALKKVVKDNMEYRDKELNLILKNKRLINLLNGNIEFNDLNDIENIIDLDIKAKGYSIASIVFNSINKKGFSKKVKNIIMESIEAKYEIVYEGDGNIQVINCWDNIFTDDYIRGYYLKVLNRLVDELGIGVFIGVGKVVYNIEDISEAMRSAKKVKKYVLTKGFNKLVLRADLEIEKQEKMLFTEEINYINKIIMEKDIEKLKEYISMIIENNNLSPQNIYDLSIKILILLKGIAEDFKFDLKYEDNGLSSTIIELCSESTRENIYKFIIGEVDELIKVIINKDVKYSPVIQQIIKIVNEKYAEELSLKTLSVKYNINSSYLGQLFSHEVGESFSEYLNRVKNNKAKELILNSNMKIVDVAKVVGYTDASYFYRKFKKYYGVSPLTFRDIKKY